MTPLFTSYITRHLDYFSEGLTTHTPWHFHQASAPTQSVLVCKFADITSISLLMVVVLFRLVSSVLVVITTSFPCFMRASIVVCCTKLPKSVKDARSPLTNAPFLSIVVSHAIIYLSYGSCDCVTSFLFCVWIHYCRSAIIRRRCLKYYGLVIFPVLGKAF